MENFTQAFDTPDHDIYRVPLLYGLSLPEMLDRKKHGFISCQDTELEELAAHWEPSYNPDMNDFIPERRQLLERLKKYVSKSMKDYANEYNNTIQALGKADMSRQITPNLGDCDKCQRILLTDNNPFASMFRLANKLNVTDRIRDAYLLALNKFTQVQFLEKTIAELRPLAEKCPELKNTIAKLEKDYEAIKRTHEIFMRDHTGHDIPFAKAMHILDEEYKKVNLSSPSDRTFQRWIKEQRDPTGYFHGLKMSESDWRVCCYNIANAKVQNKSKGKVSEHIKKTDTKNKKTW